MAHKIMNDFIRNQLFSNPAASGRAVTRKIGSSTFFGVFLRK